MTASAERWGALGDAMVAAGVNYRPWESQGLNDDECFVCATALSDSNRTVEDVLPRWMQREIMPPRQPKPKIHLPNDSLLVPKVLIPACKPCNNEHLSKVEIEVSRAFKSGAEAVRALPERTLRIWFAKIAYGLRRHDMRLRSVQRDPEASMLARASDLKQLSHLHTLLQECRGVVGLSEGHSTFFAFESQQVGCNICDFDLAVPIGWPYPLMVRLGSVTLMGAVDDRGSLESLRLTSEFATADRLPLHPIQVRALWALLVHRSLLLREDQLPVLHGVPDGQLLIHRQVVLGSVVDAERQTATADQILRNLIGASVKALVRQGGIAGLFLMPDGTPRTMPFQHGALSLGD
ncbi:hypothetical protein [Streptomyces zaomyceticus]|uniref:hypothetical protein n=1 Tax=Streptomyces zaomyceticus TaxID=68286 RepID=UPI001676CB44|nr:hypothetical protein [Streptomyces zaomyceticus]